MKFQAGRRSDIWSLGCTVIEMSTAEPPWPQLREEKLSVTDTLKRIVEGPDGPELPEKVGSDGRSFLEKVLVRDHTKRPYSDQLLRHRFVLQDTGAISAPAAKGAAEAWGPS